MRIIAFKHFYFFCRALQRLGVSSSDRESKNSRLLETKVQMGLK